MLTTGRSLYQFNVGNMTRRTGNVQLRPTDTLDISRSDGRRLGLANGDLARLKSRYGEVSLQVTAVRIEPVDLRDRPEAPPATTA